MATKMMGWKKLGDLPLELFKLCHEDWERHEFERHVLKLPPPFLQAALTHVATTDDWSLAAVTAHMREAASAAGWEV
jgi:hypothetical protein